MNYSFLDNKKFEVNSCIFSENDTDLLLVYPEINSVWNKKERLKHLSLPFKSSYKSLD